VRARGGSRARSGLTWRGSPTGSPSPGPPGEGVLVEPRGAGEGVETEAPTRPGAPLAPRRGTAPPGRLRCLLADCAHRHTPALETALRYEATSRLFGKGLDPMEVAAITGYKTLQMLKRYTHLRAEDLVDRSG